MSEQLIISGQTKKEKYTSLLPQIKALTEHEPSFIANLANTAAALKEAFGFFWVGFYLVEGNQLVLGPFQGPIACTRISFGKGVCGAAWQKKEAVLVPDVEQFPGHIACSDLSKSEVVLPLMKDQFVFGILDVDSDKLNDFDEVDVEYLTQLCTWLVSLH
jgi:L-methionine (R)-S-oxide reductase